MPFIDLTTPLGTPTNYPAWSAINYEVGQVVSYNNQIWMCIARGTVGSFDTNRWQPIGWVWGTGKQSTPTGTGNADVIISNDGVHLTAMGHQIIGERFAAEISRIARTMLE
jgi:lysophospholipase L1-like esterase